MNTKKIFFRFLYRLFNVGGFALSFRLLADAFRSLRRLWLVFAFLALPFVCSADATSDAIDRVNSNISNLVNVVLQMQVQVNGISGSLDYGGNFMNEFTDLKGMLDELSDNVSDFRSNFNSAMGRVSQANTVLYFLNLLNTKSTDIRNNVSSIAKAVHSISNVLSSVDFEGLTDSVQMIEQIVGDIYMDVYEIKGILQSMLELQDEWSGVQTNLLNEILDKISDLVQRVNDVTEGAGSTGGGNAVLVEGTVDVGSIDGTVQLDPSSLWDFSWSFSGDYIKYLDRIAGKDKWHPDYILTESATIYGEGGDYRAGVMTGFQNILDLQREQLEASQRILLCLNPTNDLSDIKEDLEEKGNDGKQETDRVADEIKSLVDEFSDFTWDTRIEAGIENSFSSFLEYANAPSEGVRFTVQGGSCMGFEWETYTVDCSLILNRDVAEFIRVWVLFIFYGGMIFLALHVFPWSVARFATIVYYLSNINKNTGGG